MATDFERLEEEVGFGIAGRNSGIPIGFPRLNNYIGIRKSLYFLIGGNTGTGKTSFTDGAFVLNPIDWYLSPENTTNIKLKIIYRSMERKRTYKFAKWVSRKIFLDYGMIVPVPKLLGWNKKDKMTKDEHDIFLTYKDYIGELSEIVELYDGPENSIGIAKQLKEHALVNGHIESLDEYNKIYIPNDENEITIVVEDTINLVKTSVPYPTKKAAIDELSNVNRYARDFYGYTIVAVSQFNREISNPLRIKSGNVEPQLEDFKESGQSQDDFKRACSCL